MKTIESHDLPVAYLAAFQTWLPLWDQSWTAYGVVATVNDVGHHWLLILRSSEQQFWGHVFSISMTHPISGKCWLDILSKLYTSMAVVQNSLP